MNVTATVESFPVSSNAVPYLLQHHSNNKTSNIDTTSDCELNSRMSSCMISPWNITSTSSVSVTTDNNNNNENDLYLQRSEHTQITPLTFRNSTSSTSLVKPLTIVPYEEEDSTPKPILPNTASHQAPLVTKKSSNESERNSAAVIIQRFWRRCRLMQEEEFNELISVICSARSIAATVIQRRWRAMIDRRKKA